MNVFMILDIGIHSLVVTDFPFTLFLLELSVPQLSELLKALIFSCGLSSSVVLASEEP